MHGENYLRLASLYGITLWGVWKYQAPHFSNITIMACDPETTTKPTLWEGLVKWTKSCCYKPVDVGLNIYGALVDIANAIREYSDSVSQRGYAVGCLQFRIEGGDSLTNGDLNNNILARAAFNNKVVGFGASILTFPTSGGASSSDDVLSIRLYDFTAGAYCSDAITLSSASKQGSHTDDGNAISDNITVGHEYGVKITYTNTDSGAFVMPDIDIIIYVEPQELTYSE
jgi:hypothetical protein